MSELRGSNEDSQDDHRPVATSADLELSSTPSYNPPPPLQRPHARIQNSDDDTGTDADEVQIEMTQLRQLRRGPPLYSSSSEDKPTLHVSQQQTNFHDDALTLSWDPENLLTQQSFPVSDSIPANMLESVQQAAALPLRVLPGNTTTRGKRGILEQPWQHNSSRPLRSITEQPSQSDAQQDNLSANHKTQPIDPISASAPEGWTMFSEPTEAVLPPLGSAPGPLAVQAPMLAQEVTNDTTTTSWNPFA